METDQIMNILKQLEKGDLNASDAYNKLKISPYEDLGYAKVDHHRKIRNGNSEVIYGEGKTIEHLNGILNAMGDTENIIITRLSKDKAELLKENHSIKYDEISRIGIVNRVEILSASGTILIATGGSSDIPVAEEAALTAEALGNPTIRLYDVGVAGIHRLLDNKEMLLDASVIIAVAGMEGALASVVGGLVDCPVIGVPTSIGYGTSFGGISALLSMLNSCASGVGVVNIDNGFGAGYLASIINHTAERNRK